MESEFDRPRCPQCGRFVGCARAIANDDGLIAVTGDCRKRGVVTLGPSWWSYDLWFAGDAS